MSAYDDTFHAAKRIAEGRGRHQDRLVIGEYLRALDCLERDAWGDLLHAVLEVETSDRLFGLTVMEHIDAVTEKKARGPAWPQGAA